MKEAATITGLFIIWNLIAFIVMGVDKYKSQHHKWRISERTLLGIAFLMGGVGAYSGFYVFRHKTKKMKFKLLLPIAVVINVIVWGYLIVKLLQIG